MVLITCQQVVLNLGPPPTGDDLMKYENIQPEDLYVLNMNSDFLCLYFNRDTDEYVSGYINRNSKNGENCSLLIRPGFSTLGEYCGKSVGSMRPGSHWCFCLSNSSSLSQFVRVNKELILDTVVSGFATEQDQLEVGKFCNPLSLII